MLSGRWRQAYSEAGKAYEAIADRLRASGGRFFFGARPSSLDALLFGHLLHHRSSPVSAPELHQQVDAPWGPGPQLSWWGTPSRLFCCLSAPPASPRLSCASRQARVSGLSSRHKDCEVPGDQLPRHTWAPKQNHGIGQLTR